MCINTLPMQIYFLPVTIDRKQTNPSSDMAELQNHEGESFIK